MVVQPEIKWGSSTDQTNGPLGIQCSKLEQPLGDSSNRQWAHWIKIAQLIENLP